jgi:type II secretory pathway pseudopilin PulG
VTSLTADDRGETLVELLITIVIMGITVVAIVGALMTSIQMSDVHRKQATAGADARSYAEKVDNYAAGSGYTPCAGPSAYSPSTVGFSASSGFTASIASVKYWSGTTWAPSCGSDSGLQQVTVQVASADARATETSVVVVRKPCGQGSTC